MTRRFTCLFLAFFIFGCDKQTDPATTITLMLEGAPKSLDPAHASDGFANYLVLTTYETLFRYKYLSPGHDLTPSAAAALPSWSEDFKTATIRLRDDLRFADDPSFPSGRGRKVDASDVAYSLLRHFDPSTLSRGSWLWSDALTGAVDWGQQGADYANPPVGVRIIDQHTIELHFDRPFHHLAHTLTTAFSAIVPREAVEYYGQSFAQHPVGSGPFRLLDMSTVAAELDRNPNFRSEVFRPADEGFDSTLHGPLGIDLLAGKRVPLAERIVIHFDPNFPSWALNLGNGTYDVGRIPATDRRDMSNVYQRTLPVLEVSYIAFNMEDPTFGAQPGDSAGNARRKALRCAIRDSYDWAKRIASMHNGDAVAFPGMIPPTLDAFDQDLSHTSIEGSLQRGKQLLRAAGWQQNQLPPITISISGNQNDRMFFELARSRLRELGFSSVRARTHGSFGDLQASIHASDIQVFPFGWILDYPDAGNVLQSFYSPNKAPGANVTRFSDQQFDQLYEKSLGLPPSPQRTQLYQAMNRRVLSECVVISGLARQRTLAWQRDIVGYPSFTQSGGANLRFLGRRSALGLSAASTNN